MTNLQRARSGEFAALSARPKGRTIVAGGFVVGGRLEEYRRIALSVDTSCGTFRSIGSNTQERDLFRCAGNRCQRGLVSGSHKQNRQACRTQAAHDLRTLSLQVGHPPRDFAAGLRRVAQSDVGDSESRRRIRGARLWDVARLCGLRESSSHLWSCTASGECRILKRKLARWARGW